MVCWKTQVTHDEWFEHAEQDHGAVLAEFGFKTCLLDDKQRTRCPGVKNTQVLAKPIIKRKPKTVLEQPIAGQDGLTYTPVRLPGA